MGDHDTATRLGCRLVLLDHVVDPGELPRHVEIVGAVGSTGFEGKLSMEAIRPDAADEKSGLLRESVQIIVVEAAYLDC